MARAAFDEGMQRFLLTEDELARWMARAVSTVARHKREAEAVSERFGPEQAEVVIRGVVAEARGG